jgi:glucose/arabinose dehydrogenase
VPRTSTLLQRSTWLAALFCALAIRPAAAITLPGSFLSESVAPGAAFVTPTALAFLPDGRLLVAEQRGRVVMVANGQELPTPVWQGEAEVLAAVDHGLLGVAVDPAFNTNRRIYFLYTVDPDSDGVDDNAYGFGRLVRYQLTTDNVVEPSTRTILMGAVWSSGPVCAASHTIGALRWGADGTLLVAVGDGAEFTGVDTGGRDPAMFGPGRTDSSEDIGAYRAQFPGSLDGKILRLDPATGHGLPSNPFFDGNPESARSRVWTYGLRNPFRFALRPGTGARDASLGRPGTLYLGDVGWVTWEEIDVADSAGMNFGWPCNEGLDPNGGYRNAPPPSHSDCSSMGTAGNPAFASPPIAAWNHDDPARSVPPGGTGNCLVAGVFYDGARYPAAYRNRLFLGDFIESWIRVLTTDARDQLVQVEDFAAGADGPVDFALDPITRDVCYVALLGNDVRRIRYVEPDRTPPRFVAGPESHAEATWADIAWTTNEVAQGRVDYGPGATLKDSVAVGDAASQQARLSGLTPGTSYSYAVTVIDAAGNLVRSGMRAFRTRSDSLVSAGGAAVLSDAWPNPSRSGATLMLELSSPARVRFQVLDLLGREIWEQPTIERESGGWGLYWSGSFADGSSAPNGIYIARVTMNRQVLTRRLALVH